MDHRTSGSASSDLSHSGASLSGAEPVGADRLARVQWLIAELRERAADCDDSQEEANLRRSADSLVRLATALQS